MTSGKKPRKASGMGGGSLVLDLGACGAEDARTAKTYSAEVSFLGDGIPFWV